MKSIATSSLFVKILAIWWQPTHINNETTTADTSDMSIEVLAIALTSVQLPCPLYWAMSIAAAAPIP